MAITNKPSKAWYRSREWQRMRSAQLAAHPYCQCPHHQGHKLRADHPAFGGPVVDHDPPHREDKRAFFDQRRLRSMTKQCHDRFAQSRDKGGAGFSKGCDVHGNPLGASDEWYGKD